MRVRRRLQCANWQLEVHVCVPRRGDSSSIESKRASAGVGFELSLSWGEQKAPTGNDKSRKKPAKSMAKSIAKTARTAGHVGQTNQAPADS